MIRFFTAHPTASNLLMVAFFLLGAFALPMLQRDTFPEFELESVMINVGFPGSSAEEMEKSVGLLIEDAISGVNYIDEVRSSFKEGVASIRVDMAEEGDLDKFHSDIKTAVEGISNLPEEANDPTITLRSWTRSVVSIAVTGPMSVQDLKAYCEQLKRKLMQLPGISLVSVSGFSDRQIRILLDGKKLSKYGISVSDVANAISSQNIDLPVGTIQSKEKEILLRFNERSRSLHEFRDVAILGGSDGMEVKLSEIAIIQDVFEKDEEKIELNGERAGLLTISKPKTADSLRVYEVVEKFVEEERLSVPEGIKLTITKDYASIIKKRLEILFSNGWQGLLLVFLTMWFFFSFRLSFWVTMGLPVSFMGTFFVMNYFGMTLNLMTSVALIIALGLLMDDAIVISENIATHLQSGKNSVQAVVEGVTEVSGGVISSFLTTACIFIPLAFIEGRMGTVLGVISIMLIIVLGISLIEAFLILPSHLAHALHNHRMDAPGKFRRAVESSIAFVRERIVGKLVDIAINWRYLTFGVVVMVSIISVGMLVSGKLKFRAFPRMEGDTLEARILLPQGTPLAQTETVVDRVIEALKRVNKQMTPLQPDGKELVENISVSYGRNSDSNETGAHQATVYADLLPPESRTSNIRQVQGRWKREIGVIPDLVSLNITQPSRGPAGVAIRIRLMGEDLNTLKEASEELQEWLAGIDGIYNLFDDMRPGKPEIHISLKQGATALGINSNTIARQIRSAFNGTTIDELQIGSENYEVDVRLAPDFKDSISDLENFFITGKNGVQIPISSVAELKPGRGYARIAHVDNFKTLTLQTDVDERIANTKEIIDKLKAEKIPELKQKYPGMKIILKGSMERAQRAGTSMLQLGLLGLLGIFALLSVQFRNYSEPLIIITAIPFSLVGVIWGHVFMGLAFTIPSMLGFVSLSGVVVNDSILLVLFLRNCRQKGMAVIEAAKQASRQRFRAVMLTSVTTIAGLFPLLTEPSMHARVLKPIATSLAFGLLSSTFLVLVVIPALYTILHDLNPKVEEDELSEEEKADIQTLQA